MQGHYRLPDSLRAELGKPVGELIAGTIEETVPVLKSRLVPRDVFLVAVGDVTAQLFVDHGFDPEMVVTDGQTKRQKLDEWMDWDGFSVLEAECPAAEITLVAWETLHQATEMVINGTPVHVKIHGEEDLLVLPLLLELPEGSIIVYGQPNTGAVIRVVTADARDHARGIIGRMDRI
ncbi:MAG: DUF359 domain-containing protein [Candidatus Kariarchaeaceae archaeon]|jgi:uncharacterized protein (UPF0218 family)